MIDADLRRAIDLIVPYWRKLSLVLGLCFLSTVVSLYLPLLSREFIDGALIGRDTSRLSRVVFQFAAITLASFGLNIISGLRYTRVSAEILFDMRLAMYRHLQQLSPRFYASTRLGDIMSRINNDIGEIQRIAAEAALAWFGNVLFLIGTVGILIWLDWRLFLLTAITAPIGLWALQHYRRQLEEHVAVVRQRSSDIGSFLIETVQGVRLVVASNAQDREVERFKARNDAFVRALMSMQMLTYLSGGLPSLILSSGTAIVFVYGGLQVIHGTLSMGTFVAFMAYQARFLSPLQALMGLYTNLATARVSFRRVSEILNVPIEVQERPDVRSLQSVAGRLDFEGVTLSLGRGRAVIDGISFSVKAGESLAIVGPSGSGKSTIVDLLLRQLDPDTGVVRLDGHDLRELRLTDIRRHIAVVEQEPCLLHASISENIRYARPTATDEAVRQAVRQAALEPFIGTLPDGLDTIVGERGTALSAGERQRLALARAFLREPAVLILDEPTAALDLVSQQQVIAGYEAVMRGRTTIVITHSLELANRADHVLVLDRSQVTEHGTPTDLRDLGGHFASLFRIDHAAVVR
jgi:ATP-binding cassette subfamily B protein